MNSYTIFQIHLSEHLINEMNQLGRELSAVKYPKVEAYNEVMWSGGSERYDPSMFQHYDMVGTIWADNLEECFAMGNGYPCRGNTYATWIKPHHSLSVGDIILVNNDAFYMVNPCGFARIAAPLSFHLAFGDAA